MPSYDPFGRGLVLPIRRAGRDFAIGRGVEVFASRVELALAIRGPAGSLRGEVPWDGGRGSKLFLLRNAPVTPLFYARVQRYVAEALAQVPQVRIVDIRLRRESPRARTTYVDVTWALRPDVASALGGTDDALRTHLTTTRL